LKRKRIPGAGRIGSCGWRVVDDSAVALRSFCSVVEALLGFEIVGAATRAPAGLALAETLQPD
jgi:hypothetical protein